MRTTAAKEEIDAERLYRSPLYSPDNNYSPRLEVSLVLKGGPSFLTAFSRTNSAGHVEALGTGVEVLKRVGCAAVTSGSEHKWQGSRVQIQIRPDKVYVYNDKKRENIRVFGLWYAARTCRVDVSHLDKSTVSRPLDASETEDRSIA